MISMLFIIFLFTVTGLYALLAVVFWLGLQRKIRHCRYSEPQVAIIIAARNEANNILACLQAIENLAYPKSRLEVVIVDDHSEDQTAACVQNFIGAKENYRLISLTDPTSAGLGKMGAVARGIENCRADFIFLTDADCVVPSQWIHSLLALFDEHTGLVGATTLLDQFGQKTPLFGKVQSLDWLYLLSIARAAAEFGQPQSWVGNNLAFRRAAYDQVGGFRELGFSLTEDFALLRAIARKTDWRLRFALLPEATVISQPVLPLVQLYHQRRRWSAGIRNTPFLGLASMVVSFLAHISIVFSLFSGPTFIPGLIALAGVLIGDLLILTGATRKLRRGDLLKFFPLFEIYYFAYTTVLALALVLDRNITWKGITYPRGCSQR